MVIGTGAGAGLGALTSGNGSFVPRDLGALIVEIPGAVIGSLTGALTDFTRSTVYKAP
jgi:outer membrane lipoprotein SlyB